MMDDDGDGRQWAAIHVDGQVIGGRRRWMGRMVDEVVGPKMRSTLVTMGYDG